MTVPLRTPAWIPHATDQSTGLPRNPLATEDLPDGVGQMGSPGERKNADAFVTFRTVDGRQKLLLVERADGLGWALPGGGLDPGEYVRDAATRELFEETDLYIAPERWILGRVQPVPDPRAGRAAWPVTVICRHDLGTLPAAPRVRGKDDARNAAWFDAVSYIALLADLQLRAGGTVFVAHRSSLVELLTTHDVEQLVG